ncbi:MAG: flagellar assembly protein FliH [Treponema sp.]|jgi:flagellar assembly protein FliH|nr:flagellar assembly protein FliH [Treponema sp.]
MIKAVFRPEEIAIGNLKVYLEAPPSFADDKLPETKTTEDGIEDDVYEGPTADELRKEAELFKSQWGTEREAMIRSAQVEADGIIKNAEAAAFQEVKRRTDEAQALKQTAKDEAEKIIANATQKAKETQEAAQLSAINHQNAAEERGFLEGHEAGFNQGKAEVARLTERTQVVLERAQDKRAEILAEAEQQLIDLALLISRKVVKILSENQKDVLIANVSEALKKVKAKGEVIIRVNTADMKLTTEHTREFIQLLEGTNTIQVQEDTSVDAGGCIIETDFGEIDARISSQMAELEAKILEITPIVEKIGNDRAANAHSA